MPIRASKPDMASSVPSSVPTPSIHSDNSSTPVTMSQTNPVRAYVTGSANTAVAMPRINPATEPRNIETTICSTTKMINNGINATTTTFSMPGWSIVETTSPLITVSTSPPTTETHQFESRLDAVNAS